jgi:ubiquinone/menaquinone biosynthesis C-methylase UbiE
MPAFENETFDFVMFSFNGLDYLSHSDRLLALGEIRRVLKPAGLLLFSSHNAERKPFPSPWSPFRDWIHQRDLPRLRDNILGLKNFLQRRA